jgi:hypothetical protein
MSRGLETCPASSSSAPPLLPLERLRQTRQQIGADLPVLAAAWAPSGERRDVEVRLISSSGKIIASEHACQESHVFLTLRPGELQAGDHLTLEVTDHVGKALHYSLAVIEPSKLPAPPVAIADDWLVSAWRLTAVPDARLDAISRIRGAQTDALGARRILEDVWTDAPF